MNILLTKLQIIDYMFIRLLKIRLYFIRLDHIYYRLLNINISLFNIEWLHNVYSLIL